MTPVDELLNEKIKNTILQLQIIDGQRQKIQEEQDALVKQAAASVGAVPTDPYDLTTRLFTPKVLPLSAPNARRLKRVGK